MGIPYNMDTMPQLLVVVLLGVSLHGAHCLSLGSVLGGSSGSAPKPVISGALGLVTSDGVLGTGVGPLDSVVGALNEPVDGLTDVLGGTVGSLLTKLAPQVNLANTGLVEALEDPLGLQNTTNGAVSALLEIVGEIVKVVVPSPLCIGPEPDVLARQLGLRAEKYEVTTQDGYILELFRIYSDSRCKDRVVVIPQSAFTNAANFLMLGEGKTSLVVELARKGNDVWAVSFRGGRYARRHVTLSDQDVAFWDFDIEEFGKYDLPAILTFISKCTGSTKMRYIGQDIAASALFVMNSIYGNKYQCLLDRAYLSESIAILKRIDSTVFSALAVVRDVLSVAGNLVLHDEFLFADPTVHSVLCTLCGEVSPDTCVLLLKLLFGPSDELSAKDLPFAFKYILDSLSVPFVVGFFQNVGKDEFGRPDRGPARNLERYNSAEAGLYDLNRTRVPSTLFANGKSNIQKIEDQKDLWERLNPVARQRFSVIPDFNFVSSMLAVHPGLLYDKLIAAMEEDYQTDGLSSN